MTISTPPFWYAPRGRIAALLGPAAWLYAQGRRLHARNVPAAPALPTICVGNMVAGGSGKTPTARALMALARAEGLTQTPCFVTRGYGGDESRLLAHDAPVIVAIDRREATAQAAARGADLAIMDDGFQNPHMRATINIVVIDGKSGFGNGCLLPAGPLREPVAEGLARADAFVFIGNDDHDIRRLLPQEKPVFTARIEVPDSFAADRNAHYVGFAGLGRPEKFHDTLRDYGLHVVAFKSFPDHHRYRPADIHSLRALGRRLDATLITTEKDAMRLPPDFTPLVMPVVLIFDDPAAVVRFLKERL